MPLAQRALRRLAGVAAAHPERVSVAVLTGRTAADVAARVGVGGIVYLGDHGLQRGTYRRGARPTSIVTTFADGHEASHEPAARLADRVPVLLGNPAWLFVERKGPSVAFHVRQADDPLAARAAVEAAIEEAERGPAATRSRPLSGPAGRRSPAADRGRQTRGDGGTSRRARPATVVAFGDNSSDADAFGVLRAARTSGTCDGLAIGVTGPRGVPDDVRASADVVLDAPLDAARLLSALARAVAERNA